MSTKAQFTKGVLQWNHWKKVLTSTVEDHAEDHKRQLACITTVRVILLSSCTPKAIRMLSMHL